MSGITVYLLYADDGARFVYAGEDEHEYKRQAAALAAESAGSLVGRRRVGSEEWIVSAFFRAQPPAAFIARRRDGFPYGLTWVPATPADEDAAG